MPLAADLCPSQWGGTNGDVIRQLLSDEEVGEDCTSNQQAEPAIANRNTGQHEASKIGLYCGMLNKLAIRIWWSSAYSH